MFRTFLNNGIRKHETGYFCSLCKKILLSEQAVLNHTNETNLYHNQLKLTKLSESDKDLDTLSESKLIQLVKNHIFQVGPSVYRCNICDCKMQRVITVLKHIKGSRHNINKELYKKDISEKNNKGNPSIRNLPSNPQTSKSLQNKQDLLIPALTRQPTKLKSNDTRSDSGLSRVCHLCKVTVSGNQNWNSHLLGINHRPQRENQEKKKVEKVLDCKLCNVKIKFERALRDHLHSKNHFNNLLDSSKTIVTDVCSPRSKTRYTCSDCKVFFRKRDLLAEHFIFPTNDCKVALFLTHDEIDQECSRCDLCRIKLSRSKTNLLQHAAGRRHKSNVKEFCEKLCPVVKEQMILEKQNKKETDQSENLASTKKVLDCKLCNVKIKFERALRDHLHSKNHFNNLLDSSKTIITDVCSPRSETRYTCSDCKIFFRKRELLAEHFILPTNGCKVALFLTHDEIDQECSRCDLCRIKLSRSKTNLLQHAAGRRHKSNVKEFCEKLCPVVKEQMILEKQNKKETDQSENLASTNSSNQFRKGLDLLCWKLQELNLLKMTEPKYANSKSTNNILIPKTNIPDANVPYKCNVCCVTICNDLKLFEHLHDEKHKNFQTFTRDYVPYIYCPVCEVDIFEDEKMVVHLGSSDHRERLLSLFTKSEKMRDIEISNQLAEEKSIVAELCGEVIKTRRRPKETPEKKIVTPHFDTNYSRKFLEVGPSNLFNIDPMKIEQLKLGAMLTILINDERICLVCYQKLSNNFQLLYEHLLNTNHIRKLNELIKNDFIFQNFRDQFSDLALAKEFLRELDEEVVCCIVCRVEMKNDDKLIREHIENNKNHKDQVREQREHTQKIVKTFTEQLENSWYIVQRLSCQLCNTKCEFDIDFASHLEKKKHLKKVENMVSQGNSLCYDVCIPCASMSFGNSDTFTKHCEDNMHKYLVKSKDYMVPELTKPVMNLIINAEKEAESLVLRSNEAILLEKNELILKSLEQTVKSHYPEAKAYIFGSRASYLAFEESDVDVFLDCGNAYSGMQLLSKNREYLLNSQICFESQPNEWDLKEVLLKVRAPIIRVRHRELDLNFDVSFMSGLTVEKTKIVKLFVTSYPPCRKMILYLKKWLKLCCLSDVQGLTTFGITWFVIFYLQQIKVLPSIAELMKKKSESRIIAGWETGICEDILIKDCSLKFKELLRGFFEFYADYDYRSCVISPLMGKSLKKLDFTDRHIPYLPLEMQSYNHYVRSTPKPEIFRIDSPLCVQDPIELVQNITRSVSKLILRCFIQYCRTSGEILSSYNENSK